MTKTNAFPFNASLRVIAMQPASTTVKGVPFRTFTAEFTSKAGKTRTLTTTAFGDAVKMVRRKGQTITGRVVLNGGAAKLIGPAKVAEAAAAA